MNKLLNLSSDWASHYPLPPPGNMMEGHADREHVFIKQGTLMAEAIGRCIYKYALCANLSDLRILDFGCGVGRVALPLFFNFQKPDYCVDVDPTVIAYLQRVIPDAHPATSSFEPPLPFADNTFDVVYAVSVWTHLTLDSANRWLDEMRRILKPGGLALLTTSNYPVLAQRRAHAKLGPMGWNKISDDDLRSEGFIFRETPPTPGTGIYGMASHDPAWIHREWSKHMPVLGIETGAILGVQDINVMQKLHN